MTDNPANFSGRSIARTLPARLFVVDDEKMLAWTLSMLLTKFGYQVSTFNNPMLAMDAFREQPADLVISDVAMPEMSGIDLAIFVRQHTPHCKILLLSGQAETPQLLQKARGNGFQFEVLAKPITPEKLLQHVSRELGAPPINECRNPT